MKTLHSIKSKLIVLATTSAEKYYGEPLHFQSYIFQEFHIPTLSLIAIPWKEWKKGTGMFLISKCLLLEKSHKIQVEIPIITKQKNDSSYEEVKALLDAKELPQPKTENLQITCGPKETFLIETGKNKTLIKNQKILPRLSGTWAEFSDYFEGNREGGWKEIIGSEEKAQKPKEGYVPPLCLHIDLSLLENPKTEMEGCGLPLEKNLSDLLKAISNPKTRFLNIILHGKEDAVNAYTKEINSAMAKAMPNRHNLRCINPVKIVLQDGSLTYMENENAILEDIQMVWDELPHWKSTLKILKNSQKEAIKAYLDWTKSELIDIFLKEASEPWGIQKGTQVLENSSQTKAPTLISLVEEKSQWEKEQEEQARNYSNSLGYHASSFPLDPLLETIRESPKATNLWMENFFENKTRIQWAKTHWNPNLFKSPKTFVNKIGYLESLTGKEFHKKSEEKIMREELLEEEKILRTHFKKAGQNIKDFEIFPILEDNTLFSSQKENNPLTEALHQWETLAASMKAVLEEKASKTYMELEAAIKVASKQIQPQETILSCLYLYGEISQRPPQPAEQKTLRIETNSRNRITSKEWDIIEKTMGQGHTSLLTYSKIEENTKVTGLRIPARPEWYVEPSTLPTIPNELQEEPLSSKLEKRIFHQKESEEKIRKIALSIRLKPKTDPITNLYLDIDQRQIEIFNPVIGKPTGLKENLLWRPVLTKQGIEWAKNALQPFGYQLDATPEVHNYVEKKVRKGERVLAPNYALTQYEMLAYYRNEERIAQKTIINPDTKKPLWLEGKNYQVTPSWDREQILVDNFSEEEIQQDSPLADIGPSPDLSILGDNKSHIQGASRIERLNQVSINFGFTTFLVLGEDSKTHKIKETINRDNAGLEKTRIAEEIQITVDRLDEIEEKYTAEKYSILDAPPPQDNPAKIKITPSILREKKSLLKKKQSLEIELEAWKPSIDDFLEAFPPEPPPLATQIYEEELQKITKNIVERFAPFMRSDLDPGKSRPRETPHCTLKNYQLRGAALMALKRSSGNSSCPGSGKTIISIMASWAMGHHYNLIIAPTMALNTWAKELEKVGLYHEIIGYKKGGDDIWRPANSAYSDLRKIAKRQHARERKTNRLGKIEPEYYIVSAETLSLGGEGNLRFNPWHFDYPLTKKLGNILKDKSIPEHWGIVENPIKKWKCGEFEFPKMTMVDKEEIWYGPHLRVWSDRADNSHEIEKAGFKGNLKTTAFRRAIKNCPKCTSEGEAWSEKGHCITCGHNHSSTTKQVAGWTQSQSNLPEKTRRKQGIFLTGNPKKSTSWSGSKTSNAQFPGYKLIGKHFQLKIIDEIHNFSSFTSQHGNALLQINTKDTIVLSGTLCRTHITELEPTLCHIYEPNSGEFPYTPWGMELFQEQFSTYEIRNTTEFQGTGADRRARRKKSTSRIPEASNLTKLRSLMHGVIVSVSEKEMAKEWNLRPISERIRYVDLDRNNALIYEEWQNKIQEAYQACQTESEKSTMIQKSRKMLTTLGYACDGPEKLREAIAWVREGIAQGKRNVIVGPSTRFHTLLNQELKSQGIPFVSLNNMSPEKRFETLNRFRESGCPVLTSRIRLINVNFNQLTCCQRILFTGIDPSPAALRQMQMRLNRIGQTENVECDFLITRCVERNITPNRNQHPTIDIEGTIDNSGSLNTEGIPDGAETTTQAEFRSRPPSYEERLFATVLRREKAIQAVLNQADKQRDPQELYDMLQDRQTLNQVLQDIASNAITDLGALQSIQSGPRINFEMENIPFTKEDANHMATPEKTNIAIPQPPMEIRDQTQQTNSNTQESPKKFNQLVFTF